MPLNSQFRGHGGSEHTEFRFVGLSVVRRVGPPGDVLVDQFPKRCRESLRLFAAALDQSQSFRSTLVNGLFDVTGRQTAVDKNTRPLVKIGRELRDSSAVVLADAGDQGAPLK